jgi:prepilin-type N-terminal cleavage/methylation domain-containing protein
MKSRQAFTLIELLVVIGIIGILAGLILPALSAAKSKAHTATCLNSKKQLQLAWQLYADDHQDKLVLHGQPLPRPPRIEPQFWWAQGAMSFAPNHADNTNHSLLTDSKYALLGDYTQEPRLYRCPADKSTAGIHDVRYPRARSISLNMYLGRMIDCFGLEPLQIGPTKVHGIPHPSMHFAFIDEHPDSIVGVSFSLGRGEGPYARIFSYPSHQHQGGATLSFVDGRANTRRWQDGRTKPAVRHENHLADIDSPNNSDIAWLQQRNHFPIEPEE